MKTFITYNAGENIWSIEPFDSKIDWHHKEFRGTFSECRQEADSKMNKFIQPDYPDAEADSIYDY